MNLGYVQEILMLAMGWQGHHLKEISYGNVVWGKNWDMIFPIEQLYRGFVA